MDNKSLFENTKMFCELDGISGRENLIANEIVNQIADMFPDMVKGHTDEGDAILKKKGQCLSTK
ncbi:MAG: hypothetical protein RSA99_02580 [Oscillospiraceae bacterium]